jgi:cobyrinic acid a,c-diamide synthase
VGKTTVSTGLVAALVHRGLSVQPFKAGPDYIDSSYLALAAGRPCRNLDSWMMPADALRESYVRAVAGADLAVVEGVMGLFDGHPREVGAGTTADVAKLLGLPVLLVINVSHLAQSAAALVKGYAELDPDLRVVGVIANNVGGPGHGSLVKAAVEGNAGLPVVGCLSRREDLVLLERHLGLVPTDEGRLASDYLERLAEHIGSSIELEAVLRLAEKALPVAESASGAWPNEPVAQRTRLAIARDEAFCFYYQDNLDLLGAHGAELAFFSPLRDRSLPQNCAGLYLGGGFPELFAATLAANHAMLSAVREAIRAGMPTYAECGGLMYLCQSLADPEGRVYPMAGVLPARALMIGRRIALGYAEARALTDGPLLAAGERARGHEFHWSGLAEPFAAADSAYALEDGRLEGYRQGNLVASYVHLHFASNARLAPNFVASCAAWGARRC